MFEGAFSPWHLVILAVVLLLVVSPKKLANRVSHLGQTMKHFADDDDVDDDLVDDQANTPAQPIVVPVPQRRSLAYRLGRWRRRHRKR